MQVYADNAATTAMSRTAIDAMLPYLDNIYGNPSSLHSVGQRAKEALDAARETVAQCLGCEPREIIFTSGGSEADNQAIISAARYGEKKGKSTSSPPLLSITPCCTRWRSWKKRALKLPIWTSGRDTTSPLSR